MRAPGRGLLAAGLLVTALVVAPAGGAWAHDALVSTDPADGAALAVAPGQVVLAFEEPPLSVGLAVRVIGPGGAPASSGAPHLEGSTVREDLVADRPAGTYTVQWRITADDGHPVSGTSTFTAASAPPTADETSSAPSSASASPSTSPEPSTSAPAAASSGSGGSGGTGTGGSGGTGSTAPLLLGGGAVVVVVAAVVGVLARRRRAARGA